LLNPSCPLSYQLTPQAFILNYCFSGGKESVYSLLEAKSQGYEIVKLLFLDKPGFSVHKVNIQAVKAVAQMLGHKLEVLKIDNEIPEDKSLINYLREQNKKGLSALVTGNVEYSKIGMQFMIIGIRDEELDPRWLGATISKQNIENFMKEVLSKGIDPCGEYGEYHSIVTGLKSLGKSLKSTSIVKDEGACTSYLLLMNPQIIRTNIR